MLLQEAPPDTVGYMIAGYVVFVVIMAIYLASFFVRQHNLEQDLNTLRTIGAENKASESTADAPAHQAARKSPGAAAKASRRSQARKKVTRRR
jgi:hypothetical protein